MGRGLCRSEVNTFDCYMTTNNQKAFQSFSADSRLMHKIMKCYSGAGIAQWLERRTRD